MDLDTAKEKLLVEYLLSSPDTFALCTSIVRPEYFNPEHKNCVKFLQNYYDKYNALPSPEQVKAEVNVDLSLHKITKDKIEYVADEIEAFCRYNALVQAVLASPKLIEEQKAGEIEQLFKDAVSVSLDKDLGIDYFDKIRERLERMAEEGDRISTGWKEVDEVMFGGHARKELLMFSANSGVGKSVVLANYGLNMVEQGYNVLYITLELSEDLISQRLDTMITSVASAVWKYHQEKIAQGVEKKGQKSGSYVLKRMATGTPAREFRAYLKEFELKKGYLPDVLIVDYLDNMGSNESVSADNVFEKDKRSSEQLRDLLHDYNMLGASASQQNRGAIDEPRINQSHVAGGISKINTSDTWISIIASESMKAAKECRFQFVKTRSSDGVGKMVTLKWLPNIRIVDADTPTIQLLGAAKENHPNRQLMGEHEVAYINQEEDLLDAFDIE